MFLYLNVVISPLNDDWIAKVQSSRMTLLVHYQCVIRRDINWIALTKSPCTQSAFS